MRTTVVPKTPLLAALLLLATGSFGCMLKSTHCKFVNDVGTAAGTFDSLATAKGDPSEQAIAKQLNSTVKSETESCK